MGRMVADVSAAIDFLNDGKGESKSAIPQIQKGNIFLLGYSLGGTVGLYTAALDNRVTGVASFCGFTPMRTDTDDKNSGGLRWVWEKRALLPLLGLYKGKQNKLPYDYDTLLSLIAPKPCLLVTPQRDRMADMEDIKQCVDSTKKVLKQAGMDSKLTHLTSDDTNEFLEPQQQMFMDWLDKVLANK
jgi:dienelactone hydrolase